MKVNLVIIFKSQHYLQDQLTLIQSHQEQMMTKSMIRLSWDTQLVSDLLKQQLNDTLLKILFHNYVPGCRTQKIKIMINHSRTQNLISSIFLSFLLDFQFDSEICGDLVEGKRRNEMKEPMYSCTPRISYPLMKLEPSVLQEINVITNNHSF